MIYEKVKKGLKFNMYILMTLIFLGGIISTGWASENSYSLEDYHRTGYFEFENSFSDSSLYPLFSLDESTFTLGSGYEINYTDIASLDGDYSGVLCKSSGCASGGGYGYNVDDTDYIQSLIQNSKWVMGTIPIYLNQSDNTSVFGKSTQEMQTFTSYDINFNLRYNDSVTIGDNKISERKFLYDLEKDGIQFTVVKIYENQYGDLVGDVEYEDFVEKNMSEFISKSKWINLNPTFLLNNNYSNVDKNWDMIISNSVENFNVNSQNNTFNPSDIGMEYVTNISFSVETTDDINNSIITDENSYYFNLTQSNVSNIVNTNQKALYSSSFSPVPSQLNMENVNVGSNSQIIINLTKYIENYDVVDRINVNFMDGGESRQVTVNLSKTQDSDLYSSDSLSVELEHYNPAILTVTSGDDEINTNFAVEYESQYNDDSYIRTFNFQSGERTGQFITNIMSGLGTGLGNFMVSISTPALVFVWIIAIAGSMVAIVYTVTSLITRQGKK